MENKVLDFIKQLDILKSRCRIVLAVSGGADSMAMAHFMVNHFPDHDYVIAHMNHGLRVEADGEEAFVRAFAKELDVEFFCHREDIGALAKERKQGIEETGREERYRFLYSLNGDLIFTAHHKDDRAETILLHLLRGCGINGLCGIAPVRGNLIRPLLGVTKEEILAYCEKNQIAYQYDLSNDDTVYTRNRIRKELMPLLKEINPNVTGALCRLSDSASADHLYLEGIASQYFEKAVSEKDGYLCLSLKNLGDKDPAIFRRVVRMTAEKLGVSSDFEHTEMIISLENGKCMPLSKSVWVYRERNAYLFGPRRASVPSTEGKEISCGCRTEFCGMLIQTDVSEEKLCGDVSTLGIFDRELFVKESPVIRTRRNGDYVILPNGDRKKLSDYFIDEKIPSHDRDSIFLLAVGDRVLWVIGHRFFALPGKDNLVVNISLKY